MTYYKLEGEVKWNHNEVNLAKALGIDDDRAVEVYKKVMRYRCMRGDDTKISEVLEKILDDNELSLAEKIYGVFMLGYNIELFAFKTCFKGAG